MVSPSVAHLHIKEQQQRRVALENQVKFGKLQPKIEKLLGDGEP